MNAANEIAVYGFLQNHIGFLEMTEVVEKTIERVTHIEHPSLEEYFESDAEARNFAASLLDL
jgi:1-deoxy-D-xylulose-5-phosphate reductoisomerase